MMNVEYTDEAGKAPEKIKRRRIGPINHTGYLSLKKPSAHYVPPLFTTTLARHPLPARYAASLDVYAGQATSPQSS